MTDHFVAFSVRNAGSETTPLFLPRLDIKGSGLGASTLLLPDQLDLLYAKHSPHVEFVHKNGSSKALLSLNEIWTRKELLPTGCTDIGYSYAGMGTVRVYTYIAEKGEIVSCIDGGATDHLKLCNAANRRALLIAYTETKNAVADGEFEAFSTDEWVSHWTA